MCSKPIDEISTDLQIAHFLHHLPQTSYCQASSQDDFIAEPLLLLYQRQQSLSKTAVTPRWRGYMTCAAQVAAQPTVPQAVTGLHSAACHSPCPLQPPAPASTAALMQTAWPNPLQSNKPGWQRLTV